MGNDLKSLGEKGKCRGVLGASFNLGEFIFNFVFKGGDRFGDVRFEDKLFDILDKGEKIRKEMRNCFNLEEYSWFRRYCRGWMDCFKFKFHMVFPYYMSSLLFTALTRVLYIFHLTTVPYIYIVYPFGSIVLHSIPSTVISIPCTNSLSDFHKITYYITCINDLCAFSFNFGISSHSQLHNNWSVIVSFSRFYILEPLRLLLKWNETNGLSGLSLFVSMLSKQFSSCFFIYNNIIHIHCFINLIKIYHKELHISPTFLLLYLIIYSTSSNISP